MQKLPLPLILSTALLLCQTTTRKYILNSATAIWRPGPDVIEVDPDYPNSTTVWDMREIGITRVTKTASPGEAFAEEWRQDYRGKSIEELDEGFASQPGLVDWSLGGVYDVDQSPFLRTEVEKPTIMGPIYPECRMNYTFEQADHLKALATRLSTAPSGQMILEAYQDAWQEELLYPSFFIAPIPESATYSLGFAVLYRKVHYRPGHVTIQSKLVVAPMIVSAQAMQATISLLQSFESELDTYFAPFSIDELVSDSQTVFDDMKEYERDPENWGWVHYARACAYAYLDRFEHGFALLERAAAMRPNEPGMTRARAMIALCAFRQNYRRGPQAKARQITIQTLSELLDGDPVDRDQIKRNLLKTISRSLDPTPWETCETLYPSTPDELELARKVFLSITPEERGKPYLELLVALGRFGELERFLKDYGPSLSAFDRNIYALIAAIGLGNLAQAWTILQTSKDSEEWKYAYNELLCYLHLRELDAFIHVAPEAVPENVVGYCRVGLSEMALAECDESLLGTFRRWWRAECLHDLEALAEMRFSDAEPEYFLLHQGRVMSFWFDEWPYDMHGLKIEGRPAYGYRIRTSNQHWDRELWLTSDQDGRKVISPEIAFVAGDYILTLLNRGDVNGACRWLDWTTTCSDLWDAATPRTEPYARDAAWALIATGPNELSALPHLEKAYNRAGGTRRESIGLLLKNIKDAAQKPQW